MDNSKAAEILEWYLEHENLSEEEKQAFQMAIDALSAKRKRKPQNR